jgi:hypothetical protein
MIMTIDFADDRTCPMIAGVEMSPFVVEIIARERLDSARASAARRRLLRGPRAALAP